MLLLIVCFILFCLLTAFENVESCEKFFCENLNRFYLLDSLYLHMYFSPGRITIDQSCLISPCIKHVAFSPTHSLLKWLVMGIKHNICQRLKMTTAIWQDARIFKWWLTCLIEISKYSHWNLESLFSGYDYITTISQYRNTCCIFWWLMWMNVVFVPMWGMR